tara:strand:- start:18520 stop:18708 length:189 start_codon:yes stop_codon:yes gene_type:complete
MKVECHLFEPFIKQNRDLHQKLITLNIPHIYEEHPGEHNAAYWSKVSNTQLFQINNDFNGKE